MVELGAANSLLEWVRVSEKDACDEPTVLMVLMVLMALTIATTIETTKRRAEYMTMKLQSMAMGDGILCS